MAIFLLALTLLCSYLIGSIPFAYIAARMKGIDLFQVGSGNIGATNVSRALGKKYGIAVFVLDYLKGALPVAGIVPIMNALTADTVLSAEGLKVTAGSLTFLGHIYPIFLKFRGGKGVATGAGAISVLVPIPAATAFATWLIVVLCTRYIPLASIVAAFVLIAVLIAYTPAPFESPNLTPTIFCLLAVSFIVIKHRTNINRLLRGTENTTRDGPWRQSLIRILHVVSLGIWFGGAGFFNFVVAPTQDRTFAEVVNTAPNERTAFHPLLPADATEQDKKQLASALFGASVGPVFPLYFAMQILCGGIALLTALTWRNGDSGLHRRRANVLGIALLSVLIGAWISVQVTEMRRLRLDPSPAIAEKARADFRVWHLVSLGLSFVTISLAGVSLGMAAFLPDPRSQEPGKSGNAPSSCAASE